MQVRWQLAILLELQIRRGALELDIQMKRSLVGNTEFFCQIISHQRRGLGLGVSLPRQIALPVRLAVPRLTFSVFDLDLDYLPGLRQLTGVTGHFAIASFGLFEGLAIRALRRNPWSDCLLGLAGLLYQRNS